MKFIFLLCLIPTVVADNGWKGWVQPTPNDRYPLWPNETAKVREYDYTRHPNKTAIVNHIVSGLTEDSFKAFRDLELPFYLDWDSDDCSKVPDNPLGFPFEQSCRRHDFGYRNFQAQGRFTSAARYWLDQRFKEQMFLQCDIHYHRPIQWICESLAHVYYQGSRLFTHSDSDAKNQPDDDSKNQPRGLKDVEVTIEDYENSVRHYQSLVRDYQAGVLS